MSAKTGAVPLPPDCQTVNSVVRPTVSAWLIFMAQETAQVESMKNIDFIASGRALAARSIATPPIDMPTAPTLVLSTMERLVR